MILIIGYFQSVKLDIEVKITQSSTDATFHVILSVVLICVAFSLKMYSNPLIAKQAWEKVKLCLRNNVFTCMSRHCQIVGHIYGMLFISIIK